MQPGFEKLLTTGIHVPESVAECLHRPLYRVSGADLGSITNEIEVNLQIAFDRISRWHAILLLDEADAFMAERSDDSLERNALVSSNRPHPLNIMCFGANLLTRLDQFYSDYWNINPGLSY